MKEIKRIKISNSKFVTYTVGNDVIDSLFPINLDRNEKVVTSVS